MNTSHLKKFAQDARRKLLEQVGAKLNFVLTTDSAELREKTEQLKQLRLELGRNTKEQLIEKVAYTWFNRLMALRFMDVNNYQPLGIRIITPKYGYTIPELLDEAKRGNIPEELKVNRQRIYDLLDNKIPSSNPQNEAYKELLIAVCNHLHTTFPFLFEKINDYTELLLPNDLTSEFSMVKDVREGMPTEDCKNVEIIGWLYQFYISEKKDEVFASKSKVRKEDIPAATQLFTPRWIVEYMVQNTLGKLWLQNRPKSRLREHMPYFIESASLEAKDCLKITSPEEIKFLDPASGSGHILVYAFDILTKIYEEEGYSTNEIPTLIIEKNLYGFEIDERAAQLSGLALMMKARQYQNRAFKYVLNPRIICFEDLSVNTNEIKEIINQINLGISNELIYDLSLMRDATNFGSLIIPKATTSEIAEVIEKLNKSKLNSDVFQIGMIDAFLRSCVQLLKLGEKYHCVVTNPPYMGGGNINKELAELVRVSYPFSKADLMACFMERGLDLTFANGLLGMINLPSWLFLFSFEKLRKKIVKTSHIDSLLHMGRGIFGIDWGSTAFILVNNKIDVVGHYFKLHKRNFQHIYSDHIKEIFLKARNDYEVKINFDRYREGQGTAIVEKMIDSNGMQIVYKVNQQVFENIQGTPIGYWLSDNAINIFSNNKPLGTIASPSAGLQTGENNRFLKYFFEINYNRIGLSNKFVRYNKAGGFRRWYGLNEHVILWEKDGSQLKETGKAVFRNSDKYFKESVSWGLISTGLLNVRYYSSEFVFDNVAPSIIIENDLLYILGLLNSKVAGYFLSVLNPTISFQVGNISGIPVCEAIKDNVNSKVEEAVKISSEDWNSHELSYDFSINPLLRIKGQDIEETFDLYKQYWQKKLFQLHLCEEEINLLFIDIYNLRKEIKPDVSLKDITILQEELDDKELIKLNKKLIRNSQTFFVQNYKEVNLPFVPSEIISQFISYSVGCMLGRYSLDKQGLIVANQAETLQDYLHKIDKTDRECSFLPDFDNIIPVLENEWFEDDIVGKFYHFLKVTFSEKDFNKNLAFIEEQIGKDIRRYFIKDFYYDHIKRYKKRPIYWMYSSPKGSFNVLIYMHRYTPDTVSNILNKYLKEFIGKLNTRKEHLERIKETGSASDKSKAIKESDNIQKMLVELHEYERDILYPLATERIEIDLDDGVLVNYNKFGKAVKEVNGINDPATKKKVKQFDWIDTNQIR